MSFASRLRLPRWNPFAWWRPKHLRDANYLARRRSVSLGSVASALAVGMLAVLVGVLSVQLGGLAAQRPVFIVALPLVLAVGFTFVLSPKLLLIAIIATRAGLNPLFEGAQFQGAGGLGGLVNLAVLGLTAVLILRDPKRIPAVAWWVWLPFIAIQFVGVTYSPEPFAALRLVLAQMSTAAMFLAAFHFVDDFSSLDRAFKLIAVSSLPVTLLTLIAIGQGDVAYTLDGPGMVSNRYAGPFPHPNILAFYLVLLIGVLLYLWKAARQGTGTMTKVLLVLYMAIQFGLLFATKTRSAWMAAAVVFLLYGWMVQRRYLIYLLLAPLCALAVPEIRDRILDLGEGNEVARYATLNSFAWRQYIWESGLNWMEPSHYLLGYGHKAFFYKAAEFFPLSGGRPTGAHNVYVQLFFDLGIVGLLAYLWSFYSIGRRALQSAVLRQNKVLSAVSISVLLMYVVVSASDNMLDYLIFNWYFWFAVGSVFSLIVASPRTSSLQAVPNGGS